jgi:putative ABC transport system permease protein
MILLKFETHKIALRAIFANKVRSFLTTLGVIIGVSSVILLVAIGSGLKEFITGQFKDLGSNTLFVVPGSQGFKGDPSLAFSNNKLSDTEYKNLKSFLRNGVEATVVLQSSKKAKYHDKTYVAELNGVDANWFTIANYTIFKGSRFDQNDVNSSSKNAVIGTTIVKELFPNTDPIGKIITVGSEKLAVVGIYNSKGGFGGNDRDANIFIPHTTAKKLFGLDKPSTFYLSIPDNLDKDIVQREIKTILLKTLKMEDFSIVSQQELLNSVTGILNALTLGLAGIAAISLLVGGIGIMNIMLVSVTERTREVGLRKAVGAKPQDVLLQFLIEAVALSSLGGAIGILLGSLGSLALKKIVNTAITPWSVIIAFGFSVFVGIAFGTWPAYKAAKKDPIEALRYE